MHALTSADQLLKKTLHTLGSWRQGPQTSSEYASTWCEDKERRRDDAMAKARLLIRGVHTESC